MRQVSFTLLMKKGKGAISIIPEVVAIVIQLSTRGTVDSDNWYLRLAEQPLARSYHPSDYD